MSTIEQASSLFYLRMEINSRTETPYSYNAAFQLVYSVQLVCYRKINVYLSYCFQTEFWARKSLVSAVPSVLSSGYWRHAYTTIAQFV
jgi:hypothetical protein